MPTPEMIAKRKKLIKQLVAAVYRDRPDHVADALARGADPNGVDEYGAHVMCHALNARGICHRVEIVWLLLEAGADPMQCVVPDDAEWMIHGIVRSFAHDHKMRAYEQRRLVVHSGLKAMHRVARDLPLDVSRAIVLAAAVAPEGLVKPEW